MTAIVWFQQDLRINDHLPLYFATKNYTSIVPVYIYNPEEDTAWPPGSMSKWWLFYSLKSLEKQLIGKKAKLLILQGSYVDCLTQLVETTRASCITYNARKEPFMQNVYQKLDKKLAPTIQLHPFHQTMLLDPRQVKTKTGMPYQVYTPFSKAVLANQSLIPKPIPSPSSISCFSPLSSPLSIDQLDLLPKRNTDGFKDWKPGAESAEKKWKKFLKTKIEDYDAARDFPFLDGNSFLAPHIHLGEISLSTIWYDLIEATAQHPKSEGISRFIHQIIWREFSYYLLHYFPLMTSEPIKKVFAHFPWENRSDFLSAWQQGKTGIPIIDAGMRQLWATGWMHNRLRMIVASFLIKDCHIHWLEGAKWFWETLVDADLANNLQSWQWVCGCGMDAAPYFRIFNPYLQSKKFDPEGIYIKKWVPELQNLSEKYIHTPHLAPVEVLAKSEICLGKTYPYPLVDHAQAAKTSLAKYHNLCRFQ